MRIYCATRWRKFDYSPTRNVVNGSLNRPCRHGFLLQVDDMATERPLSSSKTQRWYDGTRIDNAITNLKPAGAPGERLSGLASAKRWRSAAEIE